MYELIISPHLDDALFSLSSYLLSYKGNIIIATLFTKECCHNFKDVYALYANMKKRKGVSRSRLSNKTYSFMIYSCVLFLL